MSTRTAAPADTSAVSAPLTPSATLGARLAAASRQEQGFTPAVSDPSVLSELHELCAAPRPRNRAAAEKRPAP